MKRTLNIFIVLLVVDIVGLGLLWWGGMSMQSKKAEQTKLREDIAVEEQRNSKLLTLKRTLESVRKDHTELLHYLYDTTDEAQIQFISEIEGLGTSTSGAVVETKSFDLVKETKTEPQQFRGDFQFAGKWNEVYRLLRLVEEFPTHIIIVRFEARNTEAANWAGSMQLLLPSLKQTQ